MLQDQHVGLVVPLQELEVELDGLLACQNLTNVVVDFLRLLKAC